RRRQFRTTDRRLAVVHVPVQNLGHAWSGGPDRFKYADPAGPSASRQFWNFFDRHTLTALDGRVNNPPTLKLKNPQTSVTTGETVTLTAVTSDVDGDRIRVNWNVEGRPSTTGNSVSLTFEKPGGYSITVTARDGHGGTARHELFVTVRGDTSKEEGSLPSL
ncbi:MAG: PKD domain-containing protein, partial [bacterium]